MPTSLGTPITLGTTYSNPATLGPFQNLEKVVFTVTGGVIVFQVGRLDATGKANFDQAEAEYPPGTWAFDQIYGIRFRSRDPFSLATLDPCTGYFDDDPDPYNPGTIPGNIVSITGAVNVQHNDALVASQPTLDFEDSVGGTFDWVVTNDGANTRVKITPPDIVSTWNGRQGAVVPQAGDYVASQVTNAADLSSASIQTFTTGIKTPNPGTGDNSTTVATTAFVKNQGYVTAITAPVTSVFGRTGAVVATTGDYTAAQVTNAADLSSVSTQIFSATVKAPLFSAITSGASNVFQASQTGDTNNRINLNSSGAIFMGPGNIPVDTSLSRSAAGLVAQTSTPPTADNSTKLATTAFVKNQGYVTAITAPVTSVFGRTGAVVATTGDYTAAQVTNAADLSSASTQSFSGAISTGPTSANPGTGGAGVFIPAPGSETTLFQTAHVANDIIRCALTTDTVSRFVIQGTGTMLWGAGGASAADCSLLRVTGSPTPAHLSIGNSLQVSGGVYGTATSTSGLGGATITPDYNVGDNWVAVATVGGNTFTINNCANKPVGASGYLTITLQVTGGSNVPTIVWGSDYNFTFTPKPTSVTAGTSVVCFFAFHATANVWVCVGRF